MYGDKKTAKDRIGKYVTKGPHAPGILKKALERVKGKTKKK